MILVLLLLSIFLYSSVGFGVEKNDVDVSTYQSNHGVFDEFQSEYNLLGPFFTMKKRPGRVEYGFRPLFYTLKDSYKDIEEFDFLFPFFSYNRRDDSTSIRMFLHIIDYESKKTGKGHLSREFTLFPILFISDRAEKKGGYFAVFPVYGKLKQKYARDEITFLLFPLHLKTKRNGEVTTSFLWPFISVYSGEHKGFRVWPFWGKRTKRKEDLREHFVLWPFYVRRSKLFYGERMYSKTYFPFYSESKLFGVKVRSYLWPLINRIENESKGIVKWDFPWPFVSVTRGSEYETRIFPLFSSSRKEKDREGFILWPLYRYSTVYLEDYMLEKKNLLLIFYRDEKYVPLTERARDGRRIDLWPFFSYEREGESSYFHVITLFEPFIRSSERWYRNYAAFWRVFEYKKHKDSYKVASLLWDFIRYERRGDFIKFDIKPLVPLVRYEKRKHGKSFKLVGGMLGYSSVSGCGIFHFLFLPLKLDNCQTIKMTGVGEIE